jgi:hypothetical protein
MYNGYENGTKVCDGSYVQLLGYISQFSYLEIENEL